MDSGRPWAARLHQESAGALYLHLPFCERKCAYCDFASWQTRAGDPLVDDYLASCRRMMSEVRDAGLLEACATAFVGGGTPTLAGTRLASLVRDIHESAPRVVELTCEANPESLTDGLLGALASAGCTRLSLGVQSLCDDELAELGRIHTARRAIDRLEAACGSGLDVSCDLMCAIPLQTDESWHLSLGRALATGVVHMSVYPLQIEEGTAFGRRYGHEPCPWNDPEVQAGRMEAACHTIEPAGLARYEVASYAKPGHACRHNIAYWTGVPYVGLGTGASSMLTREGYERLRSVAPQLPQVSPQTERVRLTCASGRAEVAAAQGMADLRFDLELLSGPAAAAEDLMLAMRMVRGAGEGLLAHARDRLGAGRVDEALGRCEGLGLAHAQGSSWVPTKRGWLLGNELYGELWGLAPDEVVACSV